MTQKRTDLAKSLGLKIQGRMKQAGVPDRFGGPAPLDRREQRRRDAAAGLVPFACKLPAPLVARLQQQAASHPEGLNGLVAQLLGAALPGE